MRYLVAVLVVLYCANSNKTPEAATSEKRLNFWFESATTKIRPFSGCKPAEKMVIKCAQNEFEPFQLAIRSIDTINNVDVEISDFIDVLHPERIISRENVTIFFVKNLDIKNRSDTESVLGEWPDILVPKVDAYYKEKRNAFPFKILPYRVQPIWFDLFVPETTIAGDYEAIVKTTNGTAILSQDTIYLHVWNFTLPATASLHSRFGLNSSGVHYGYYGDIWKTTNSMKKIVELQRLYMRAGLRHRLSFTPMDFTINNWNGTTYTNIDDKYFKQTIQNFIGDGDPGVEYGNSELTALFGDLSIIYRTYMTCGDTGTSVSPKLLTEVKKRLYITDSLLPEQLKNRYCILPIDEPGGGEVGCGFTNPMLDYNSTIEMAKMIKSAGFKTRVTKRRINELLNTKVSPPRNDYMDMWIVPFNRLAGRDYTTKKFVSTRTEYDADIAAGAQLWWYQGCNTHGCGITGGKEFDGYPQYLVEFNGIRSRIFPWLSFKYDVTGELYWSVVANFYVGADGNNCGDPWFSLWNKYYANGEGTLFYPGVANTVTNGLPFKSTVASTGKIIERGTHTPSIGGIHDIPIESIRLKMIREGYEDYEYMFKLVQLGDGAYAKKMVNSVVENTFSYFISPAAYERVRDSLALRIQKLTGSSFKQNFQTAVINNIHENRELELYAQKQCFAIDVHTAVKRTVKCEIYDVMGKLLVNYEFSPVIGRNLVRWNDVLHGKSAGFYLVRVTAQGWSTQMLLSNLAD